MKNVISMLEVLFQGVKLRRWNGIYKSEEFVETSKQGLNAAIAYILAKMYEKKTGKKINYTALIELSICRMTYKAIFTDINPGISYRLLNVLKPEADKYAMEKVKELGFEEDFCDMFAKFLKCKDSKATVELQIYHAASKLATCWEFNQIKSGAGQNYLIQRMEKDVTSRMKYIKSLEVVKDFMLDENLNSFVDLYANTAFIQRWARYEMNPKISDLSHMYTTAVATYILMTEANLPEKRCIDGFYIGLFHDTIEILTGDLPHPLKKNILGLKQRLTEIELEEYNKVIKPLLPDFLNIEMEKYVLTPGYAKTKKLVKISDNLSAYVEVITSVLTGTTQEYYDKIIKEDWEKYKDKELEGIVVKEVYEYFHQKYLKHLVVQ